MRRPVDHGDGRLGQDSSKAVRARTAQPVHYHGLRLVIRRVPDGHRLRPMLGRDAGQEFVARLASLFLQRGRSTRKRAQPFDHGGKTQLPSEAQDKQRIRPAGRPPPMIEVCDHDGITELMQAAKQAETVGAAGHAQHDTLARGEELFAADEFRNSRNGIHGRGIIASRSADLDGLSPFVNGAIRRGILRCWPRIAP